MTCREPVYISHVDKISEIHILESNIFKSTQLLGLNLSLDTHIDDLLVFFQNLNKFLFMFMKCKQTQK
jgi:hypothetical protein